jgi:hypothetical protein
MAWPRPRRLRLVWPLRCHWALAQIGQQARQGEATAPQLLRAQSQASTQAAREAMPQSRLASQEAITGARTASAERIQALTEEVERLRAMVKGESEPWDDPDDRDWS